MPFEARMNVVGQQNNMWYQEISLPLQLTLVRLIGSPFILPFLIVYLLPFNTIFLNAFVAVLFLAFGLTDFFDGYFARKYEQKTIIGASLDHLADKCLMYSTLIALVAVHKVYFMWAIIWIGREFLVMGVRVLALEHHLSIAVSSFGKSKTAVQIMCLAFVICNPYQALGTLAPWWNGTELLLLIIGTVLSIFSAYNYCVVFYQKNNSQLF